MTHKYQGRSNWQRKPKGVTMTHKYQGRSNWQRKPKGVTMTRKYQGRINWQRKPKGVTMTHELDQRNKKTATKENMGTGALVRGRGSRRRSNPLNFEGNPMHCKICDSVMHFQRDCPHSYENQSK